MTITVPEISHLLQLHSSPFSNTSSSSSSPHIPQVLVKRCLAVLSSSILFFSLFFLPSFCPNSYPMSMTENSFSGDMALKSFCHGSCRGWRRLAWLGLPFQKAFRSNAPDFVLTESEPPVSPRKLDLVPT